MTTLLIILGIIALVWRFFCVLAGHAKRGDDAMRGWEQEQMLRDRRGE